jgi:ADP-heptose:LPS heptosyltransferase
MNTQTIAYNRNGLGNFIMMTPALQALAELDPSGKIDICIDSEWQDNRREALISIIKALPFVQNMVDFPKTQFTKEYKTWFWTRHTYPSAALDFFKSKAPEYDISYEWINSKMHEIDFYMSLVRRRLGWDKPNPPQFFPVAKEFNFQEKRRTIALCNGSYGHLAGSKQWPYFRELAERLKNFFDIATIKIGYGAELADVICDIDCVGKLNILETASVVANCDLLVTVDTCNMHIADSLYTPMVVIWGGSVWTKNRPVNPVELVKHETPCAPCHESGECMQCEHYRCLSDISASEVMYAVRKVFTDRAKAA